MLSGYAFLKVSIRRGNVIDEISQIASLMAMVLNWICELRNCFTSVSHQRLVLPRWVHEVTFLRLWDCITASHLWSVGPIQYYISHITMERKWPCKPCNRPADISWYLQSNIIYCLPDNYLISTFPIWRIPPPKQLHYTTVRRKLLIQSFFCPPDSTFSVLLLSGGNYIFTCFTVRRKWNIQFNIGPPDCIVLYYIICIFNIG